MPKVVPGYKAEARRRIVAAAERLFITKGYRRSTMDDVAEALGVSKGALYQYYRSKIDLLRAIQAQNRALSLAWMNEALERRTDPARGFAEKFEEVFRQVVSRDQIALYFEILGEAAHDEEIQETLRVDHREDLRNLRNFLAQLRRRGLLASDADLDVLAFMVIALFQGAVWDMSIGLDPAQTRRRLSAAMDRLLAPPADGGGTGPAASDAGGSVAAGRPAPRRATSSRAARGLPATARR
ncbi:MAG TPA: TetR/AcrR family transcriptional regulator [Thermoplasmata archaeon]|nr:TetR/AcrR family transcriptional regulator [Thermoplasmata archaeon]